MKSDVVFSSIASSSRGNSTVIKHKDTSILIDCGISGSNAVKSLSAIDIDAGKIKAILVTHEHRDHTSGVGVLSRRFNLPVYATEKTWNKMSLDIGNIRTENMCLMESYSPFCLGDIEVLPFQTPHDSVESVGFNFFIDDSKYSFATDIGHIEESMLERLLGSCEVIIESNHDVGMLKSGNYPYFLKQRILGEYGHLSNDMAAVLAYTLINSGTQSITLAHLSCDNNTPTIAKRTVCNFLEDNDCILGKDYNLTVAPKLLCAGI